MRARSTAWPSLVLVLLVAIAAASVALPPSSTHASDAVSVDVEAVPLDPSDPARTRTGALVFQGGIALRSDDPRFGGLSDLRVSEDGRRMLSVTDCGHGFVATLAYGPDGRLSGLSQASLLDLVDPAGAPVGIGERDAESLVEDGSWLEVGFEGRGRILAYRAAPPFAGPAEERPAPDGLARCGSNAGLETLARLEGTQRLAICEGRRGASTDVDAWVGDARGWVSRSYPLFFAGGWTNAPFRPTSATRLPGGDVLVLERRFPPIAARVTRISREQLGGTGAFAPAEVARFEPPLTVDNFEGIDARRDGSGRTLVYLLSDDNNCAKNAAGRGGAGALQRTLLLMFALEG